MTINEMVVRAHKTAIEHGWHDEPRTFGDCIALAHSELSEALEAYRNDTVTSDAEGKPIGVGSELADVLIRIADMCGEYGIDLESEVIRKMAYNETRPYRHGGKRL